MAGRYQHGGGYFPEQIHAHNTQGLFPTSFPRGSYQSSSFTPPQQFGSNQTWSAGSNQQLSVSGDQEFVKQFEENVMTTKQQYPSNTSSSLKIPEARHLLRRAVELINLLKKCSDAKDKVSSQVVCLQSELDNIQHGIQPSLEDLVKKVRGRAKKRERNSSRKHQLQSEHEKRCRDAHKKADEWLAEKEAKKLKLKMEKEVKLSAANTLLEVETKQSDALRYIKFVELLEQLKSHRLTMRHKSTDQSALQADQKFHNTVQSLHEFLSSRKLEYEKERKALHVIMEEEVQDRIAAATKPTQAPFQQPPLQDSLQSSSVYALLHIRKQWDVLVSPIGTPLPKEPLLPSTPSSPDWEAYLVSR